MFKSFQCRRTFVAIVSISCLTVLGYHKGLDVSMAIATIAVGLGAANAAEKSVNAYSNKK